MYANRIKDRMQKKGVTIRDLAYHMDKHKVYIHRIVNPDVLPKGVTLGTLDEMARILDCRVDDLYVYYEESPNGK